MAALTIEAHVAMEEAVAAEFFPPWAFRWLKRAHRKIRERGFPPAEVARHSRAELRYFRRFAPWAVERIKAEHVELALG